MIEQESTFSLRFANKEVNLDLSISTWFRYANPGLQGVKLETVKKGGATHTSREAIWRFFNALTERRYGVKQQRLLDAKRDAHVTRELERRFGL